MSSEGAAGASAAARRRGAASRKAKLQARAPEEDILARLTGDDPTLRDSPSAPRKSGPVDSRARKPPSPSTGQTAANSAALA